MKKMELEEIKYRFIIDLTKFFIQKYNDGEIKDLELIVRNVKALSIFVKDMSFVYDETIWHPDKPERYKNLIEFKVQLKSDLGYLPFRLFIKKGENQEPIFLDSSMMWNWNEED
jgi:hypothetical protein